MEQTENGYVRQGNFSLFYKEGIKGSMWPEMVLIRTGSQQEVGKMPLKHPASNLCMC